MKQVKTPHQSFSAKTVVSSEGRWDQYPSHFKPGLAIGTIHLVLNKKNLWDPKIHTQAYLPENLSHWLTQLDQGKLPEAFGFHLFNNALTNDHHQDTINVFFYLPRGMDDPDATTITNIENYILNRCDSFIPQFKDNIIYKKFVSPKLFQQLYGCRSTPTPLIMQNGFSKPNIHDSEKDVYYIGNSVFPPGEHSSGALYSALEAAKMVDAFLSNK